MKKQILPLFPLKKSTSLSISRKMDPLQSITQCPLISVDKKVAGFYKIYKKISFPKISKKSIKKTTPVKMNKLSFGACF